MTVDTEKRFESTRRIVSGSLAVLNVFLWNFSTMLARDYAERYPQHQVESPAARAEQYIPLLIFLAFALFALVMFFVFDFSRMRKGRLLPYQKQPPPKDSDKRQQAYTESLIVMGSPATFIGVMGAMSPMFGVAILWAHVAIVVSWIILAWAWMMHHRIWKKAALDK